MILSLTANAAREAGIGQDIEIELDGKVIDGIPVGEVIQRFKDRLSSWEQAKA